MILTIVHMGRPTANERGYGTTLKRGLRNHYVNTIVGELLGKGIRRVLKRGLLGNGGTTEITKLPNFTLSPNP